MRHQQVKVDYWEMVCCWSNTISYASFLFFDQNKVKTSSTYLCLVISGWILFKLVHAVFIFPDYLKRNQVEYEKVYAKMEEKCKPLLDDEDDEKETVEQDENEPKKDK